MGKKIKRNVYCGGAGEAIQQEQNNGILFKVIGNNLPNKKTEGTYYILNQNSEMVTFGKYKYMGIIKNTKKDNYIVKCLKYL